MKLPGYQQCPKMYFETDQQEDDRVEREGELFPEGLYRDHG